MDEKKQTEPWFRFAHVIVPEGARGAEGGKSFLDWLYFSSFAVAMDVMVVMVMVGTVMSLKMGCVTPA